MFQFRLARLGLLLAAIGLNMAPAMVGLGTSAQAETLRSAVGTPLKEAKDLMAKKKFKEALVKINEAGHVSGLTGDESFTIERMRASAAAGAGDNETAARSFEALIASGKLSPKEKATYTQSLGGMYYSARNYPKAIVWLQAAMKEGGDSRTQGYLTDAYFRSGQFALAYKELDADVRADERAGRTPSEDKLRLFANAASRLSDKTSYPAALEKVVTYYPQKDMWASLLSRVQAKPGYASRLTMDVYRLKRVLGLLSTEKDYFDMASMARQDGFAAEANSIVEQGFKQGILNGPGTNAGRNKRLQDIIIKDTAANAAILAKKEAEATQNKDSAVLFNLGYDYATNGQLDKGVALMKQGISSGNLKHPDDARLHLGVAYALAGKKSDAIQTFKTVKSADGSADLARYWIMQLNHPVK